MDGILLVNKVEHCSSYHIVRRAKKLLRVKKVGHGGTLDPFAKGLLILLLGRATKLFGQIMEMEKTYRGTVMLGVDTDTYDRDGTVVGKNDSVVPSLEQIEEGIRSFLGLIYQRPPKFSAIKVGGRRAYELARKGVEFQVTPREVVINRIQLESYEYPFLTLTVEAGKGFYMRTLAYDLGQRLGVGAHLYELTRVSIGPFSLEGAIGSDQIAHMGEELPQKILPLKRAWQMIQIHKQEKEERVGLHK